MVMGHSPSISDPVTFQDDLEITLETTWFDGCSAQMALESGAWGLTSDPLEL